MRTIRNNSLLNYRLAIIPKNILQKAILLFKGFRPKGCVSYITDIRYYSKDKYFVEPEPMPFEISQKVTYTGNDSYLLQQQRLYGHLTVSGFYDRWWLNVSCSPMSYEVADFQALEA